ncbi:MAG: anthranilate phosphoribosyltransferase [Euryarchaeota archaeon RBG_13_57_23]|nr:MAG: anthranilate phosphoribosyltransferase [Euryarchaeota archaeon RBG_13_57_23]
MIRDALGQVVEGRDLSSEAAREVMREMISGTATQSQMGAFLTAMRMKGETEDELRGFVIAMRETCSRIEAPAGAVDLCGTGGDGSNTFNISTAASFVVAAAGVPVAKHGNRSVSSKCGSADLLASLGIPFSLPPQMVQESLRTCGLGFMFAPVFHQSMKNVIVPRREIGLRTVFNLLGPMTNPAGVKNQLIGVYDGSLAPAVVRVLKDLGTERAVVVNSAGMDEITNTGSTRIHDLRDGHIDAFDFEPGDLGFDLAEPNEIRGGDAAENARIVYSILKGERSPRSDVVVLNAAAGIYASGKASTLAEGRDMAVVALNSGRALQKARQFSSVSWALEGRRQSESGVATFSTGRIHPTMLVDRAGEITAHLQSEISRHQSGAEMLSCLDPKLLTHPNALSVLVLRRILSIMSSGAEDGAKPSTLSRSKMKLSDSIASSEGIAVIAEYKPRSPSCVSLTVPPDPDRVASAYSSAGVAGASVLVEPDFFSGGEDLFAKMRSGLEVPMLFKDFVVSGSQVEAAHRLGADALLLMAKALSSESLAHFVDESLSSGIEPLVEIHDEEDLAKLRCCERMDSVRMVGINSRDLRTLKTDLNGLEGLRQSIGEGKIVIAESGISTPDDLGLIADFDAVLIGSAFMRAEDLDAKVREIVLACRSGKR